MRILVLLALTVIIIYLVRNFLRRLQAPSASAPPPPRSGGDSEPMQQCLHCKAYFPASEAVVEAPDRLFCSEEHRRQHHTPT